MNPAPPLRLDLSLLPAWTPRAILAERAHLHGNRTFLHYVPDGRKYSYAEFDRYTQALAGAFMTSGIAPADHVAVLMENRPEQVLAYLALGQMAAVVVPVNTAGRGQLLKYYLELGDCKALLVDEDLAGFIVPVAAELPLLQRIFVVGDAAPLARSLAGSGIAVHSFPDPRTLPVSMPDVPVRYTDLALLMYTSGTTGPSKAVMMTHASAFYWAAQRVNTSDYRAGDVDYTCMPLFHGNALLNSTYGALMAGTTVALTTRFSGTRFWADVKACGATRFNAVGAIASFLWARAPGPEDRDHRVRVCTVAPTPTFVHEFQQRFGVAVHTGYGITDYCTGSSFGTGDPPEKVFSTGRVRDGVRVRIVDDDDRDLPRGIPGEILLRNEVMWAASPGYYRMPEATVESRRNLWFHTGDRGYLDADGFLWFVDRKKDAIRRRGENISAFEVESIIAAHPAVQQVAVYALRSELTEDEVAASVVLRAGATLTHEELIAHCVRNMSYFMVPRYVEFVAELPMTLSQKVQKFLLRERAERDPAALWDREKAGIVVAGRRPVPPPGNPR